jgi:hypothetical protein
MKKIMLSLLALLTVSGSLFAQDYGPRPYSSLTFGPTLSGGMGLALNF